MSKSDESNFNRRRFLQLSAAASIGGVCFSSYSIKQALAEAKQAGKPLLTERNFNALLPSQHDETLRRFLQEAKQDLKGLIKQKFHLTDVQERELSALSDDSIRKIQTSIDEILEKKATVRLEIRSGKTQREQNHAGQVCVNGYWYKSTSVWKNNKLYFGYVCTYITCK